MGWNIPNASEDDSPPRFKISVVFQFVPKLRKTAEVDTERIHDNCWGVGQSGVRFNGGRLSIGAEDPVPYQKHSTAQIDGVFSFFRSMMHVMVNAGSGDIAEKTDQFVSK